MNIFYNHQSQVWSHPPKIWKLTLQALTAFLLLIHYYSFFSFDLNFDYLWWSQTSILKSRDWHWSALKILIAIMKDPLLSQLNHHQSGSQTHAAPRHCNPTSPLMASSSIVNSLHVTHLALDLFTALEMLISATSSKLCLILSDISGERIQRIFGGLRFLGD